jgi:NOL1/NOP2/fmu family ribosome biogenesis protein
MRAEILILNSKERKLLRQLLDEQFGITTLFDDKVLFCINKKERVYITNKEIFDEEQDKLRVNAFGLYIGSYMVDGFRFSLEGAQLLGPQASKNIIELDLEERNAWFRGEELEADESFNGQYVLLKSGNDFCGVGRVKNEKIMNYLSKSRKLTNVFVA